MPRILASGPLDARIAIVGEAPGQQEELVGIPFIGTSGGELTRMLTEAGISRDACFLTNVFMERPWANDVLNFCGKRAEVAQAYSSWLGTAGIPLIQQLDGSFSSCDVEWPPVYNWPPLKQGAYVKPEYLPDLYRLQHELETVRPNVIVALGNAACWALLGTGGISKIRGTVAESTLVPGVKVIPTYHPAAILRQWDLRATAVLDLRKALRESAFPEIVRPKRQVWIEPTLADLHEFKVRYIDGASLISCDIETMRGQIDCIGFAPSKEVALVVPFVKNCTHYWKSEEEEVEALQFCRDILTSSTPKVFQNGMYDIQYIYRVWHMSVRNASEDTMLLHHALQPELPKALGFLGSVYTNELSWKLLRERKADTEKRDE